MFSAVPPLTANLPVETLQLFNHYLMYTSATMDPTAIHQQHIWRVELVQLGFHQPFLLHALLGIAAMHQSSLEPSQRLELVARGSHHMNTGLQVYQQLLDNPEAEKVPALVAFSFVIVIYNFAMARAGADCDALELLIASIDLTRGVPLAAGEHWETVMQSGIAELVTNVHIAEIDETRRTELDFLRDITSMSEPRKRDDIASFSLAIAKLRAICAALSEPVADHAGHHATSQLSKVLSWPAALPSRYIELLHERDSTALVILAHYAALCKVAGDCWWLTDRVTLVLSAINQSIEPEFQSWLEWANTR